MPAVFAGEVMRLPGKMTLFCKRLMDILLSFLGLIVLSPLILGVALAVRLEDGGPALFRQERVTKNGRVFRICKFRTMRGDRVTRVGKHIRSRWMDELPQLWNVLTGDMSLVGPRPLSIADVEAAKRVCPAFTDREAVRAGLTGTAQLLGRHDTPPREKLALDRLYTENLSLRFDAALILQTIVLLFQK